ncbi:MAG TPA: hypothetical protein VFV53_05710 [Candidatus Limnocylindrales bacterium]|nr:hypothetical protein [Candidatus Limnocylindrales bacterium]
MRHLRIALAVAVLAGGFSLLGLAAPGCAYACSCIQPQPIAEYANEPGTLILKGTVTVYDETSRRGQFHVERWFKGSSDLADIPIRGGDGADCGLTLTSGQTLVMVAFEEEGVLAPNICSPWGDLATAEGQALEAQTIEAFGEGVPVPEGGDTVFPTDDGFAVPMIVPIAGGVIVLIIGVIALASFVSGRRGP